MHEGTRVVVRRNEIDGHEFEQHVLSRTHLPWRLGRREPEPSSATVAWVTSYDLGSARLVECMATPVTGRRDRPEISHTDGEWIAAHLQLQGRTILSGGQQVVDSRPGDVSVWDSTVPAHFAVLATERKQTIFFPRHLVLALRPSLDLSSTVPLPRSDAAVGLFRAVAHDVTRHVHRLDDAARLACSRVLLDLLVACLQPQPGSGRAALQAGLFTRACALVERQLADPALSPAGIAAEMRVPLRTLQDVFAQRGETISGHIRGLRLAGCHAELQRAPHRTVGSIAGMFGFVNATHFSRSFRQTYGMTPREVRAQSLSATSSS